MMAFIFGCNTSLRDTSTDIQIGTKFQISINGLSQTIIAHTNNDSKPVLLILHGGPGYAMLNLMHEINPQLEDEFIVVNWDQRGASLSPETDNSKMTLEQFVSDAHELSLWLKERFSKQKIYIMGHSFGTVLALNLIKDYPNDYYAYIGIGQVVGVAENEIYSYDWALEKARSLNNSKAKNLLEAIGRPDITQQYEYKSVPTSNADDFDDGYEVTSYYVSWFGGDIHGKKNTDEIENLIFNSGLYNQESWINAWEFSQSIFEDTKVWDFDAKMDFTKFDIPVYFFMGKHDYDTPVNLFMKDYNEITTEKHHVEFESSAHFPFYEEPEKFRNELLSVKSQVAD